MSHQITARHILDALKVRNDDVIWVTELRLFSGSRRIDFWTLMPSAANGWRATAYEIKVSRGDFRRDSAEKQEGAIQFSDRFWYVTPPGLISPDEIPDFAGLQEWDGTKFKVIRKPPMRVKRDPSWELVCSILRCSSEMRRDVSLMRSQIAFYEQRQEAQQTHRRTREQYDFERLMRRARRADADTRRTDSSECSPPAVFADQKNPGALR